MKRIKYFGLVLLLMLIPIFNVNAEESSDEIKKFNIITEDNVTENYQVDGSSMIFGNSVDVTNTVNGIDMVFGNTVTYNGNSDYSLIAGNVVNVEGTLKNDGFVFGNMVTFNKSYIASRDLFVFGNSVVLRGEIKRDVVIYSSSVVLEDVTISGNITINADNFEIKNATINGTLSYNENADAKISDEAIINEKNTFVSETDNMSFSDIVIDNIIDYASTLFTFAALVLILPGLFKKLENKLEDISLSKFISMLGYGLLFLIAIPIVFIVLLMLVFGVQFALLLLTLYIVVICLSTIFAGYFIGLMIWKKFIKKETNMLLVGLIGISLIKVLSFIPYINVITTIIVLLLSLSVVSKLFTKDA